MTRTGHGPSGTARPAWSDDPLWRFAYQSRSARPFGREELNDLVRGAALRNATLGVTSMLVHWDRSFFQVLEGPRETVLAILDCFVLPASAHSRFILAHQAPCDRRLFGNSPIKTRRLHGSDEIRSIERAVSELLAADRLDDAETVLTRLSWVLRQAPRLLEAA